MIKKFIGVILLVLISDCFASMSRISIEGKYDCKGTEIGSADSFHCEMIIKKTGKTYASTAKCSDGSVLRGNGIYIEKIHALSSAFSEPKRAGEAGVTLSFLKEDGTMNIEWTYLNTTEIGYTSCIKKK